MRAKRRNATEDKRTEAYFGGRRPIGATVDGAGRGLEALPAFWFASGNRVRFSRDRAVTTCLIGLGSNVGDRQRAIQQALSLLSGHPRIEALLASRLYPTRPACGEGSHPEFLNAAARLETSLTPHQLLAVLRDVEQGMGRVRLQRWGPRAIDLDLLLYGDLVLETPLLVLPHPRMAFRRFVLFPALEVAAEMVHPPTGWTVQELLRRLDASPRYVALAGAPGAGKTALAEAVRRRLPCRLATARLDSGCPTRPRGDQAGLAWQMELEFLQLRLQQLAPEAVPREQALISDFWFDQSLVYARLCLPGALAERFESIWRAARQSVPSPQLVVLLKMAGRPLASSQSAAVAQIREGLARQASRPGQSPLLHLDTTDFDGAVAEVTAAIQAMGEPPA